jgi:predicted Ser/Thr protein kinase
MRWLPAAHLPCPVPHPLSARVAGDLAPASHLLLPESPRDPPSAVNDQRTADHAESPEESETTESPSASPPPEDAPGGDPRTTIAGRYEVNLEAEPVGAGIAVAYLGRDLRTRAPVTVKTLRLEYRDDPDMRARFRREARLLQFLSHPNVVRALTFTEERGAPWLIIERVPGRTLREELDANAPVPPEAVVPVLEGTAAALDHLHARGLIHLDLRPENIMVTPNRQVKLIDFGLAQTGGSVPEVASSGSHPYLAPEQLTGESVEVTTDVYALGCVVYEMLTGTPPFAPGPGAPAGSDAVRARLTQQIRPPSAVLKSDTLPPWVDDVVLGALERDPQLRYGSAGLFAGLYRVGVEGETDVETGRPNAQHPGTGGRHFPINEPGIAVKGSSRLARRRAEPDTEDGEEHGEQVIDVAFAPVLPELPHPDAGAWPRSRRRINLGLLERRLWQACAIALLLNVLLIGALVATKGEVPGIWQSPPAVGPGSIVRIAGTGLVARTEPRPDAEIAAELPDGGTVQISGDAVVSDSGLWWPVEVQTDQGPVTGYVPQSWVHP